MPPANGPNEMAERKPDNPRVFDALMHWRTGDFTGRYRTELTLRDLFAAFALAGMMAANRTIRANEVAERPGACYAWADSMLREREKGGAE